MQAYPPDGQAPRLTEGELLEALEAGERKYGDYVGWYTMKRILVEEAGLQNTTGPTPSSSTAIGF